jgi:hypothetical protein
MKDSIHIGNCTIHLFGMEDWSKGKVEESFPWWLFHRKITGKETSIVTSFFPTRRIEANEASLLLMQSYKRSLGSW